MSDIKNVSEWDQTAILRTYKQWYVSSKSDTHFVARKCSLSKSFCKSTLGECIEFECIRTIVITKYSIPSERKWMGLQGMCNSNTKVWKPNFNKFLKRRRSHKRNNVTNTVKCWQIHPSLFCDQPTNPWFTNSLISTNLPFPWCNAIQSQCQEYKLKRVNAAPDF